MTIATLARSARLAARQIADARLAEAKHSADVSCSIRLGEIARMGLNTVETSKLVRDALRARRKALAIAGNAYRAIERHNPA